MTCRSLWSTVRRIRLGQSADRPYQHQLWHFISHRRCRNLRTCIIIIKLLIILNRHAVRYSAVQPVTVSMVFMHLLLYQTSSDIGHRTCQFVGKIRKRLAAGDAPVAVKRRAVVPVKKVKTSPNAELWELHFTAVLCFLPFSLTSSQMSLAK
jgi:hypothetical protein